MRCDRCGEIANSSICSMFNTEQICVDCKTAEEAHPDYTSAREAEASAVSRGEFNFPGVGKPADL